MSCLPRHYNHSEGLKMGLEDSRRFEKNIPE
jgi:hypothetical protein